VAPSLQHTQSRLRFHTVASRLEHKLANRPQVQSLIERNIVKETLVNTDSSPSLMPLKQRADVLQSKLIARPERKKLITRNIMKGI
jgi:hypothetical protein